MTILYRSVIAVLLFLVTFYSIAQNTTVVGSDGLWGTAANWSNGVPAGGGETVIVNKSLILNADISFGSGSGGSYTINSPVNDQAGGTAYSLSISNSGALSIKGNLTIEGTLTLNNSASLTVESGDTLIVGNATFAQSTTITIKAGGVMIVNGNVDVNNTTGIACDGELIINGNYSSSNSSSISGSGTMSATGTITSGGSSLVFGSGNDCTSGPCSGNNLCGANSNKISASQSICSGIQPAQLNDVANPGGTYTVQWQSSTTSGTGGFAAISSATNLNYQPGTLSQNTWYRRVITQGTCVATSPSLQILVGTPAITSQPADFSLCASSGTAKFTVAATGNTQLTYQWKLNGSNISNVAPYSGATTSTLTIAATTSLNGNNYQCVVTNPGCSVSATSNSAKLIVAGTTPSAPTANAGSGATCSQITSNWTASANTTSYYLDVATDNGFTSMVLGYNSKNVGNVTSYTITGLTAATTYYYRVRAYSSCGISASSNTITYSTLSNVTAPVFSFGSTSTRCQGSATVTYSATASNTTGITYSLDVTTLAYSGNSINSSTGAVTYAAGWSGASIITASAAGCSGPKTSNHTVTISAMPVATFNYSGPYCTNGTNPSPTFTGGGVAGTFTSTTGLNFVSTSTGQINLSTSTTGSYTVTNTIAASSVCPSVFATSTVTINTVPTQPSVISGNATPCINSTGITYSVTNVSGVTYVWTYSGSGATITSGSGTNAITVSYSSATNGNWTVTPNNSCGNGTPRSLSITLGSVPTQPSTISTVNSSPCANSTGNTYSVLNVSGVSYSWTYSGTGATITSGNGTNAITVSYSSATNGSWNVTPSNSCGNGTAQSLALTLGSAPSQPSTISAGNSSPCANSTGNTYSVLNVSGVSYNWIYSGTGATITSGNGTNAITISYSSATSGSWIVIPSNSCGSGTAQSLAVTFGSVPSQPSTISAGNSAPCANSTGNTYSVLNVSGVSYNWIYSGTGATITSGSGTNSISVIYSSATSGSWTVTPSNSCGSGTAQSLAVTFGSVPSQPSTISAGNSSPCANSIGNTYSVLNVSGTSYNWIYSGTGTTITAGSGTNAITVSYSSSATSGNWTVTPSNNCGVGTAQTTSVSLGTCTFTWVGSLGTDWATAGNWSGNVVPSSSNNVLIPPGPLNMPIISGSADSKDLTIQLGATLKNNLGGALTLAGNFNNSGTFIDTGAVVLNGSAIQTITGITTFNNLTLDNASGAKLINAITIKGILTLSQGALDPNGNLMTINLNSGAIAGTGTGSITEPIKVIKFCGAKWYRIGNPLGTYIPFSQFTDNITVAKGVLYRYDETNPSTVMEDGWVEIPPSTFNTTQMVPMIGYDIYVYKQTTFDVIGMYNHNFSSTVYLTNTSSGQPLSDGWNFISNPYPSTIDWDAATGWGKSGITNALYVRDDSNDRYMSYINGNGTNGGSRYISSMQGFWVKCNTGSGSISLNNNARVTSPVMKLYKGQATSEVIKLKVSSNGYSDETILKLNSEATSDFDQSLDAYKLKNSGKNPNISSLLNGVEYSINTLSDTLTDEIIPLRFTSAFTGQYKMSVDLNQFESDLEVTLIDKNLNVSQDLKLISDYAFNNSNTDASRFYIRFKKKESVTTELENKNSTNVFIGSDGSVVTIKLNSDLSTANMSVVNMLGNEVFHNQVNMAGGLIREQLDVLESGMYIVKLTVGNQLYTGRVFIK